MYALNEAAENAQDRSFALNLRSCPQRFTKATAVLDGVQGLLQGHNGDAAYAAFCNSLQDQYPTDLQQPYTRPAPQHAPTLASLVDDQHPFAQTQAQDSTHTSPHSARESHSIHPYYNHAPYCPHTTESDHIHVGHLDSSSYGTASVHALLGNPSCYAHATNADHTHFGHSNLGSCGTTPVHTCGGNLSKHAQATNSGHTHFGHLGFSSGEPSPVHSSFGSASHSPQLPSPFLLDVSPVHNLHRIERVDQQQSNCQQGSPDEHLDLDEFLTPTSSFHSSTPSLPGHKQDTSPLAQAELPQPNCASTHPDACCSDGPSQHYCAQHMLCAKPSAGCKQGPSQDHFEQPALCADTSLVSRRIAKRDSARRMRAKRQEQLNSLDLELHELLASKTLLDISLKEVDSSIPSLQHQLDATLSSTQEMRRNNEALQQEVAELQSMAKELNACLHTVVGPQMPFLPGVHGM